MKAIMVMFDSLRRDLLSVNGGPIPTPNFERLAAHSVTFDNCYVGSLPCIPARRELHTGRYNFLHRSWGPVEPFDDSMPEILKNNGIHSHLSTDHYHYLRDGGATYTGRYSTWECMRGQENDPWGADLAPTGGTYPPNLYHPERTAPANAEHKKSTGWQNMYNREKVTGEDTASLRLTFDSGLDFLEKNGRYDNWFLQIEAFDPHEPFTSPDFAMERFLDPDEYESPDWPPYSPVGDDETADEIDTMRKKYFALTSYCDDQLGRVLDMMDAMDMWDDTMLIVNTDHGFLLSEHDWWGKGSMPDYNELVHTPLFIWDPRCGCMDERRNSLVQTIDLAPTILEYFGIDIPKDMLGKPLRDTAASDTPVHEYALFGYFGGTIGITDGRYKLLRAPADLSQSVYEYTLMPVHMASFFSTDDIANAELYPGFSFTKGCPVLKIATDSGSRYSRKQPEGADLMFDLENDPDELDPTDDRNVRERLLNAMRDIMKENDAPAELYARYGL